MINFLLMYWAKLLKKSRGKSVRDSRIHPTARIGSGSQVYDSQLGRYSYCGYDCVIVCTDVGEFTSIAENVRIGLVEHPTEWISSSCVFYQSKGLIKKKFSVFPLPETPRTTIGSDVWIGHSVLIKAGVQVGDGAVIAMGAVVTKDVLPYSIVGGVPAKEIKKRFSDETIQTLLASAWWERTDEEISKAAPYVQQPLRFLEELNQ